MARDCEGHECGMIANLLGGNLRSDHDKDDDGNCPDEHESNNNENNDDYYD